MCETCFTLEQYCSPSRRYSRFQVIQGLIEGFFGFEIFNSGDFFRWENVASIFLGGIKLVGSTALYRDSKHAI